MNYEKLPKTISAEELLSTPLPPVKWIIPDLLPAGLALFASPSKAGKSWLTLWLCLQVAQGKPMWGREIEPHTVLYLSLEDTFNCLQKRLLQLVGSEEAPERLVMQTECGSIGQGLEEQLTSFIYQHPDTGLIVIDTLQKVRSSDQNNSMYPLIGGIPLAKLRPMTLEEMCEELRKRPGRGGKCIKETTVQKYLETVSSVLEDAKKNDIIPFNPAHRVRKKHFEKEVQHIPQKYEMGKLMRAIQNEAILYRAYYTLAITTGLRRGELCALQWRDITGACELTVHRSRSCASGQIVESDTKSHRERIVTIPLGIWELLMALRQQQVLHSGVPDREQPIFTAPDGHVPHPDTFTRHLRKLYKKCGLSEDYHLHTLRHFYATYLLQEGTSKQVAASLLGHADTAFLERTYCHPQDVAKQQAANLMQDLLNNQNPCYVAFMKNRNRKPKKAG